VQRGDYMPLLLHGVGQIGCCQCCCRTLNIAEAAIAIKIPATLLHGSRAQAVSSLK